MTTDWRRREGLEGCIGVLQQGTRGWLVEGGWAGVEQRREGTHGRVTEGGSAGLRGGRGGVPKVTLKRGLLCSRGASCMKKRGGCTGGGGG